jgi:undecaprenyl-diphosphatase
MNWQKFDASILHIFYDCPEFLWNFAAVLTQLSNHGLLWIFAAILLLSTKDTRRTGWLLALGLVIQLIFVEWLLKSAVARARPALALGIDLRDPLTNINSYSFPSGHSMVSFLGADMIGRRLRPIRIPLLVLAALIALTRVICGAHFPLDIFVGAMLGLTLSFVLSHYCGESPETSGEEPGSVDG